MANQVDAAASKKPTLFTIAVGVDGSSICERAMQFACRFVAFKRSRQLCVLHVQDAAKAPTSRHLQPAKLKETYEDMAARAHVPCTWACRSPGPKQSLCHTLANMAEDCNTSLLVVGSAAKSGDPLHVLGSVSDYSLRQCHTSICIVRPTSRITPSPLGVLFAAAMPLTPPRLPCMRLKFT